MFQKDWLQRQIEMLTGLLARLLQLRQDDQIEEAQQAIDEAYRELFGLDPRLIGIVPDSFLVDRIMTGDRVDGHRGLVLAVLLRQDGANRLAGDDPQAQQRLALSLRIFLTVAKNEALPPEHAGFYDLEPVLAELDQDALPPDLRYDLFLYYEDAGRYARAEDVLLDLIESSDAPRALAAEGIAFYEWLLALDDAELAAGNLPRAEVEESLDRLRDIQPGE